MHRRRIELDPVTERQRSSLTGLGEVLDELSAFADALDALDAGLGATSPPRVEARAAVGPSSTTIVGVGHLRPSSLSQTLPSPGLSPTQRASALGDDLEPTTPTSIEGATTSTASPSDPAPGTIIAESYRVLRPLGRGGMGSVVLARDDRLHRDVAVKVVDHVAWGGIDARQVFLREARAMARVQHPNVVTIFAFGEHDGAPYFAMEYVPGTTLERLLRARDQPLPLDRALSIIDQLCRGLEAIHRAGALHCDVKPANVLIGPSFRVAVADLGLSRIVGEQAAPLGGTPGYVAPEILARASGPDERVDVYAAGVIAYDLLTGRLPFEADSLSELVDKQLSAPVAAPSSVAELPEALDEILLRAMARDPAERHSSVEAFRRELLAVCNAVPRTYRDTLVFVVDDDAALRWGTTDIIAEHLPGSRIRVFRDGRDALAAADEERPDIAIVDLEMPGINGVELTAALRARPRGQQTDVVMVTGVGNARDWEVLHRLGASGFLLKPVDEAELGSLVRRLAIPN
ncbi:MAG: serine/threonine-protein kinase [Polyangiaceae bacterium]